MVQRSIAFFQCRLRRSTARCNLVRNAAKRVYLRAGLRLYSPDFRDTTDLTFVRTAQRETWQLSYGRIPNERELQWLRATMKKARYDPKTHISILVSGGQRIGYFWLQKRSRSTAVLLDLYVHQRFRRKGFGKLLCERAIAKASKLRCRLFFLSVS